MFSRSCQHDFKENAAGWSTGPCISWSLSRFTERHHQRTPLSNRRQTSAPAAPQDARKHSVENCLIDPSIDMLSFWPEPAGSECLPGLFHLKSNAERPESELHVSIACEKSYPTFGWSLAYESYLESSDYHPNAFVIMSIFDSHNHSGENSWFILLVIQSTFQSHMVC